jgi:hypothetical protein
MGFFIKRRAKWNFIKRKLQLTIGILAFISLLADSIQIIEFLNQHIEIMKDLIKMTIFAFGLTLANFPLSSIGLVACLGWIPNPD